MRTHHAGFVTADQYEYTRARPCASRPHVPTHYIKAVSIEPEMFQQRVCSKADAAKNAAAISVTSLTSLKEEAEQKHVDFP